MLVWKGEAIEKRKSRVIKFSYYDSYPFVIIIDEDYDDVAVYSEIMDGDNTGGLMFLFGIAYKNQTDDDLIKMVTSKCDDLEKKRDSLKKECDRLGQELGMLILKLDEVEKKLDKFHGICGGTEC